jgi:hypothetical protein
MLKRIRKVWGWEREKKRESGSNSDETMSTGSICEEKEEDKGVDLLKETDSITSLHSHTPPLTSPTPSSSVVFRNNSATMKRSALFHLFPLHSSTVGFHNGHFTCLFHIQENKQMQSLSLF